MNFPEDRRAEKKQLEDLIERLDGRVVDVDLARETLSSVISYTYVEKEDGVIAVPGFEDPTKKKLIDSYLYEVVLSREHGAFLDEQREAEKKVERINADINRIDTELGNIDRSIQKGPNADDRKKLIARRESYERTRVKKIGQLEKNQNALAGLTPFFGPFDISSESPSDYFTLDSVFHENPRVVETIEPTTKPEKSNTSVTRSQFYQSLAAIGLLAAGGLTYLFTTPSGSEQNRNHSVPRPTSAIIENSNVSDLTSQRQRKLEVTNTLESPQTLTKYEGLTQAEFDSFLRETLLPLIWNGKKNLIHTQYNGEAKGIKVGDEILDSGYTLDEVVWQPFSEITFSCENNHISRFEEYISLDIPPEDLNSTYTLFASKEHKQVLASDNFKGNIFVSNEIYAAIGKYLNSDAMMLKIKRGSRELHLPLRDVENGRQSEDFTIGWLFDGIENGKTVISELMVGLDLRAEYRPRNQNYVWLVQRQEERANAAKVVFSKINYSRRGESLDRMVAGRYDYSEKEMNRSALEVHNHLNTLMLERPFRFTHAFGPVLNFKVGEGHVGTQTSLLEADWENRELVFQVDKNRIDVKFFGDYAICELPNNEYLLVGKNEEMVGYAPQMRSFIELNDALMRSISAYGHDIKMIQLIGKQNALLGFTLVNDKFVTDSFDPSLIVNHRNSKLNLTIDLDASYNVDKHDRDPTYSCSWKKLKNNPAKLYFEAIRKN